MGVHLDYWWSLRKLAGTVTTLPKTIAMGNVEKVELISRRGAGSGEVYEVALLRLEPNAQIKKHKHQNDTEEYIFLGSMNVVKCLAGGSHSLKNDSKNYMYVLSIKKWAACE